MPYLAYRSANKEADHGLKLTLQPGVFAVNSFYLVLVMSNDSKMAKKSKHISFRLPVVDFEKTAERAFTHHFDSVHCYAKNLLLRDIYSPDHAIDLMERTYQNILKGQDQLANAVHDNRAMLIDILFGVLMAFDTPKEKADVLLTHISKYC
ncbi:hypothetical protein PN498_23960 [Oscillatoria sp. CS-180]|uniref:hypothetical protein n=1 Tax=Oscillatoria sp. CS-180 TaxID=3021720 RepID=UPI00232C5A4C|nr:hypothetical protein [Oscillatoria sp. CS-180]MDB9529070.1 hypothetical protein [Oscillatoria sp. CS-180]